MFQTSNVQSIDNNTLGFVDYRSPFLHFLLHSDLLLDSFSPFSLPIKCSTLPRFFRLNPRLLYTFFILLIDGLVYRLQIWLLSTLLLLIIDLRLDRLQPRPLSILLLLLIDRCLDRLEIKKYKSIIENGWSE
ncbi:hypothetical protein PMAYCL1PPCAC_20039 [Pristionchus mayeri]|uniref:Uncharacterized protein n=1 Tax=Pristionchus mayeri TaxID=1317129 RepID=A0AAN5I311_9BILA|nr:hypothetical protein PMAYCL1PPCAC_20039 [Pristionchus mayeri]